MWYAFEKGGTDMKNIPMFTTENGVASLILQEIPYRREAYVHIRCTAAPELLFRECFDFCKMAGAEKIYFTGHPLLETHYPFHTSVLRLRRALPENRESGCLFPVQRETLEKFREIYNRRMATVDNAATLTLSGAEEMLKRGNGYFVHDGKTLLGIGMASGGRIDCVIAEVRGAGQRVMETLFHALSQDSVELEVASTNVPAMALYERMGFVCVEEKSRWYGIF